MDDSELKSLLQEIRDLQKAQFDLLDRWHSTLARRQQESIEDAATWRKDHLLWQRRQALTNVIFTVFWVAGCVLALIYFAMKLRAAG